MASQNVLFISGYLFIDLVDLKFGDEIVGLLGTFNMPRLDNLELKNNNITSKGINVFINGDWSNLSYLNLSDNQIGDEGAK